MQVFNRIQSFIRFGMRSAIMVASSFVILSGATVLLGDLAFPTAAAACHCDVIKSTKISDTTYQFNTNIVVSNSVKLTKVMYNFGDGSTDTETDATKLVTHTFKPGSYTIKATAYFDDKTSSTTAGCTTTVTVPQPPVYACTALDAQLIDAATNKYQFTAKASVSGGATLQNASFDFGDGHKAADVTPTGTNEIATTYQYATAGDYTIIATLNFAVANEIKSVTCAAKVSIAQSPVYACTNLSAIEDATTKGLFHITAQANTANGATLNDASFDFGDGNKASGVKPSATNKVTIDHTYAQAGNYAIVATLNFTVAGNVKSTNCQANVTVTQQPTPQVLPSTGPSDLLGSAVGLSSIVAAGTGYLQSRRSLKLRNR